MTYLTKIDKEEALTRLQHHIYNLADGNMPINLAQRIASELNLNLHYNIQILYTESEAKEFLTEKTIRHFSPNQKRLLKYSTESVRVMLGKAKATQSYYKLVGNQTPKIVTDSNKIQPFVAVKYTQTLDSQPIVEGKAKLEEYFNYYLGIYI